MNDEFEVFEFRYFDRTTKQAFCVYARKEETAKEIIDIVNKDNPIFHFVKPKLRRFKRRYLSKTPPYELEQEQIEVASNDHKKRLEF